MTDRPEPHYEELRALDVWGDSDDYQALLAYDLGDGWTEVFRVVSEDGVLIVAAMALRPTEAVPTGGLTTRRLRKVPVAQALVDARRIARQLDRHAYVPVSKPPDQGAGSGPSPERLRFLEHLSDVYDEVVRTGSRAPSRDVYRKLLKEGQPRGRGTVRNDLREARRLGLIGDATRRSTPADDGPLPAIEAGDRALDVRTWDLLGRTRG